jgi:hypothetical protein
MRRLAEAEEVRCHGVLWVFDQMEELRVATAGALLKGFTLVREHPRCRLPDRDVALRLARYAAAGE